MIDINWAYANGQPQAGGDIRVNLSDFEVDEDLGFEAIGEGEHWFLTLQKKNANTEWVARQIAQFVNLPLRSVSFAGMKDRRAITRQTFSIHLPGKQVPQWDAMSIEGVSVLSADRHPKKLRRGSLRGNRFQIIIRNVSDIDAIIKRVKIIEEQGFPNYFGPQRFGIDGGNIESARSMFLNQSRHRVKKHEKGLLISSARSLLFNDVLSRRVEAATWNLAISGDVFMLDATQSVFVADAIDEELANRIRQFDLSPTGPLWGKGELMSKADCLAAERQLMTQFPIEIEGLESTKMKHQRRPLRARAGSFGVDIIDKDTLKLSFFLAAGCYATSLLRELLQMNTTTN